MLKIQNLPMEHNNKSGLGLYRKTYLIIFAVLESTAKESKAYRASDAYTRNAAQKRRRMCSF